MPTVRAEPEFLANEIGRGYPWWPGTERSINRPDAEAQYQHFSKFSFSACNARPVHTDGQLPTFPPRAATCSTCAIAVWLRL